jgi:Protein of unknown function (DUF2516)
MPGFDAMVLTILYWGALALILWAFVDALVRPTAAYVAAGKLTKPAWLAITGIAAAVSYYFGPMSFLGLPAIIAGVIYLVDVRPALRGLRRGNSW